MNFIKQKTIKYLNNQERFDEVCNNFREENDCIATQTTIQYTSEGVYYIAVIFYQDNKK